jgi:transposase InsO family protein
MGSRLRNGTPFRVLNIVDEFTREALACHVDRSISSADVIAELTRLFAERGKPPCSTNQLTRVAAMNSRPLSDRSVSVTAAFIEKGSPQQNAFVERFNGTMRDELLKW